MSKAVKDMVTNEYRSRYEGLASACVIDMTGMSVKQQQSLRASVREKSGRIEVVKNSLARRAFSGGVMAPLGDALEGPCALVTSHETSVIDLAKTLVEAAKAFDTLKLKTAIFDGDAELMSIDELSKMKGLRELIGEIAMLASSPGRAIAGCVQSPAGKIAGCLKTLAERAA